MHLSTRVQREVLTITLAIILGVSLSTLYYSHINQKISTSLEARNKVLKGELIQKSEKIDRNEPTKELAAQLTACPNNERFDDLLSRLATLKNIELTELGAMFDTCGDYPSLVKRLSLMEFKSTLDEYARVHDALLVLHPALRDDSTFGANMTELYNLELERSQNFRKQIQLQKEIIAILETNSSDSKKMVAEKVGFAQTIGNTLNTLNTKIDDIRAQAVSSNSDNDNQP